MSVARRMIGFAAADLVAEWRLALVLILNMAAVVGPILLFLGLRAGVVENLRDELRRDPASREILLIGQERFTPVWFEEIAAAPEVAFVAPRTRFLNTSLRARNLDDARVAVEDVELVPSGVGDPLLADSAAADVTLDLETVVLSANAARRLERGPGDTLQLIVGRTRDGRRQSERLTVRVGAVAPLTATSRLMVFADPRLMLAVERYREFTTEDGLDFSPMATGDSVASFRLYAREIDDVAPLRERLLGQGLDIRTEAARIAQSQRLGDALGIVIAAVAGLIAAGGFFSMAMSLGANTLRKARDLSVLTLLGYRARALTLFPLAQAVIVAAIGGLLGLGIYAAAAQALAAQVAEHVPIQTAALALSPGLAAAALGGALLAGLLASLGAAAAALRLDPTEKLRDA